MSESAYEAISTAGAFYDKIEHKQLRRIAGGGTADVFSYHHDNGRSFALKIYRSAHTIDWAKLSYQVNHQFEDAYSVAVPTQPQLAWPLAIITANGKKTGIVMPYLDRADYISLDNWIEHHLLRKIAPENDSLSRRLLVLSNLARLIANLHSHDIAVVDLKPSNVLVYRRTGDVCLIDCDSFRVKTPEGAVHPGSHVSAGYIAPEAFGAELDIASLAQPQDRFAFAVIAFQVLNYGIHPFQGILVSDISGAETNDQKAQKGLYPYGLAPSSLIKPLSQSVHETWPAELRALFDQAFTTKHGRPALATWGNYFNGLLTGKTLVRCEKFPNEVRHIHFDGHKCSACMRHAAVGKISSPAAGPYPAKKPHPKLKTPPPVSQRTSPPASQVSGKPKSNTGAVLFAGVVGLVIIAVVMLGRNEPPKEPVVSPPPQDLTANTDRFICSLALGVGRTQWETRKHLLTYVQEARRRGLSVDDCRRILGLPSKPDTAAAVPPKSDWITTPASGAGPPVAWTNSKEFPNEILLGVYKHEGALHPFIRMGAKKVCGEDSHVRVIDVTGLFPWTVTREKNDTFLQPREFVRDEIVQAIKNKFKLTVSIEDECATYTVNFSLKGSVRAIGQL